MKKVFQQITGLKDERSSMVVLAIIAGLLLFTSLTAYHAIPRMVGGGGQAVADRYEQETIYKTSERSWHGLGLGLFGGLRR